MSTVHVKRVVTCFTNVGYTKYSNSTRVDTQYARNEVCSVRSVPRFRNLTPRNANGTINKGNAKIHPSFSRKTSHVDQCGNKQSTDKNASATLVA